jgi:hypothetical protein
MRQMTRRKPQAFALHFMPPKIFVTTPMFPPELTVILLNVGIILLAYLSVYPALAGNDFNKIALYDFGTSGITLAIVGYHYWGSDYQFNLLVTEVNWFWFTLATYTAIEIPVMLWYFKKHKVVVNK